jgi:hypothetical protein
VELSRLGGLVRDQREEPRGDQPVVRSRVGRQPLHGFRQAVEERADRCLGERAAVAAVAEFLEEERVELLLELPSMGSARYGLPRWRASVSSVNPAVAITAFALARSARKPSWLGASNRRWPSVPVRSIPYTRKDSRGNRRSRSIRLGYPAVT